MKKIKNILLLIMYAITFVMINTILIIFLIILITFLGPVKGIILYELSLSISIIEIGVIVFCIISMNLIFLREINNIQWKIALKIKKHEKL